MSGGSMAGHTRRRTGFGLDKEGRGATLAVAGIMAGVVLIPTLLNATADGYAPVRAGERFTAGAFRFEPEPSWRMDVMRSMNGQSVLVGGSATYTVRPLGRAGSPHAAYLLAARRLEEGGLARVSGVPRPFRTRAGQAGLTGEITGAVEGRLSVVHHRGRAVAAVLIAPPRPLPDPGLLRQAERMTASLEVPP
ncbi:hypothetical protein [Bailinhaonella thermotolerans]|uniref:hypothetical protein n=1 Tax=Bailinhaonella thermotolerans TaxID=1070861 RepID=UPI001A8DA8F4|nr:hypothetical protein [Bailinhaonella thermotolerans]